MAQAAELENKSCNAYVENLKEFSKINLDRYSDIGVSPEELAQENFELKNLPFQTGNTVLENQGFKLNEHGKLKGSEYLVKWTTYKRFFGLFGNGFEISLYKIKDGEKTWVATHRGANDSEGIRNAIEALPTCVTHQEISERENFFEKDAKSVSAEKLFNKGEKPSS